ncbi:hypothetical protein AB0J72_17160 [Dactylosporangium sp. NPDC049742]|uniref:hypothetical protein n=1 Tax=Dactylosporangium sp. NPDC049742 TaxID=3154737 RepID=UPI0034341F5E
MLFLCTHNAGRSQMALGFFTHLAGDPGLMDPTLRYEGWATFANVEKTGEGDG